MSNLRAYRSKIGRLPFKVRNELCNRIRDGATGTEILAWVNALPEWRALRKKTGDPDINPQNLTDWRTTGYAHWLADQDRTAHIRELAELSQQMVEQAGGDPAAVGSRILAGTMLTCLESASPQDTEALAKALTALRKEETSARKTDIAQEMLALKEREFALERQKFQRHTCELFIQWTASKAATSIITDKSTNNDAKTEALGRLMFGDLWDDAPATNTAVKR